MVLLRKCDVPTYLHSSDLYLLLSNSDDTDNDDDSFDIPEAYLWHSTIICHNQELEHLLSTMRYWGANFLPMPLIKFVFQSNSIVDEILEEFGKDLHQVATLFAISKIPNIRNQIEEAVKLGDVLLVDYLFSCEHFREADDREDILVHSSHCTIAAKHGHLALLQYLHEKLNCIWTFFACNAAAEHGHLQCLKYLHTEGCEWYEETCAAAAKGGQLTCLIYAHNQGCPWDRHTCSAAITANRLNCLKYALENGCSCNEMTAALAAEYGRLEYLRMLHKHHCPWNERVCERAAAGNHLSCLQYAHEQGCGWTKATAYAAARHKDSPVCLQYAALHGCPAADSMLIELRRRNTNAAV